MPPALNPNFNNAQGKMDVAISRIDRFSDWLLSDGSRMTKKDIQEGQKAVNALKSTTNKSTKVDMEEYVQGYNTTVDIHHYGNSFQLSFWIYALHDFKTQADWFYVRQEALLNASALYYDFLERKGFYCGYEERRNYIGKYEMNNYLLPDLLFKKHEKIFRTSPENASEKIEVETGMDWEFSGNLGFEGKQISGSGGFAVVIKNSQRFTIEDCKVYNKSTDYGANAKWLYQFREASPIVYPCYLVFTKPATLQTGLFSPINNWLWRFEPQVRDSSEGRTFKSILTFEYISSVLGDLNPLWRSWGKHIYIQYDWAPYISLP